MGYKRLQNPVEPILNSTAKERIRLASKNLPRWFGATAINLREFVIPGSTRNPDCANASLDAGSRSSMTMAVGLGTGFFTLLPALAFAQPAATCAPGTYRLIAPVGGLTECLTLTGYLSGVFLITIGIAGVLAVVMIVVCGIKMMMSGSVSGKSEAKGCITNAVFGLLIALGAYAILYTINPELLRNDITLIAVTTNVTGAPPAPKDDPMPTIPGWYFRYSSTVQPIKNSPMWISSEACEAARGSEEKNGVTVLQTPPRLRNLLFSHI